MTGHYCMLDWTYETVAQDRNGEDICRCTVCGKWWVTVERTIGGGGDIEQDVMTLVLLEELEEG